MIIQLRFNYTFPLRARGGPEKINIGREKLERDILSSYTDT